MTDPVDVFRRISWLIFKWLLGVCAVVIVLGLAIAAFMYVFQWYTHDRHLQKVQFIVETDREKCSDDKWPIQVLIGNLSEHVIAEVSFSLAARVKGRSTDLAKYHDYRDDHIIAPQEGYATCWAVPELKEKVEDPRTLEWSISYKRVSFQP